jgi:hypothetical protein
VSLKDDVLAAALELSQGDLDRSFTAEQLLVAAWRRNKAPWGLRGFETEFPDTKKITMELDRGARQKSGVIGAGLLQRVDKRVYTLTPAGLAAARQVGDLDREAQLLVDRNLEAALAQILDDAGFRKWRGDPAQPKKFREAGRFWGVAPGTPPRVIRDRIHRVDTTLAAALTDLERRGGKRRFDRETLQACVEFQAALKDRFAHELDLLKVELA